MFLISPHFSPLSSSTHYLLSYSPLLLPTPSSPPSPFPPLPPLPSPDNTLLFLDPHTTQPVVQVKESGAIPDSSYHTANYGRMSISGLDPSIALGFFCKDENDIDDLVERLKKVCRTHVLLL